MMGGDDLPGSTCAHIVRGERKVLLDEHALPDWESLANIFETAHGQGRGVATPRPPAKRASRPNSLNSSVAARKSNSVQPTPMPASTKGSTTSPITSVTMNKG